MDLWIFRIDGMTQWTLYNITSVYLYERTQMINSGMMIESELEKIRDVQKEAWNKSCVGWKKWDQMMMGFLEPMNNAIIRTLNIKSDDIILDVATGTGEPGLTMSLLANKGEVTGVDLSEGMLKVAAEKAERENIKNFNTVCCDISNLPFDDNSFDKISCRLGFMLFPDIQLALSEMMRVLKPGGKISGSVWGSSEKNSWVNTSMSTMIERLGLKKAAPGAPGIWRCAESGFMTNHFKQAGFKNIHEETLDSSLQLDSINTYWEFITEVASPVAFAAADDQLKQEIKNEVLEKVRLINLTEKIELRSNAIIISGEK
jgi:ubiquinone/menaquinone biosynthesis C-methylase UbiE